MTEIMNDYMNELVQLMADVQVKMSRIHAIKEELIKLKTTSTNSSSVKLQPAKITCSCGCTISKTSWAKHIKTKKHLNKVSAVEPTTTVEQVPAVEQVPTVEQVPAVEPVPVVPTVNQYDSDEDSDDEVYDKEVDKQINIITEMFYKGLYVYHYENQNFLIISLRKAIYNQYKNNRTYKLSIKEINDILDEHLETYPIKYNEQIKTEKEIIDQILKCKLFRGIPISYCISNKNLKQFIKVIKNSIYTDYCNMMNRYIDMALVRDHYKQSVIQTFNAHVAKYGLDQENMREYITIQRSLE
jgi:hypothetical protein